MENDIAMTVIECAKYLKVSKETIYRMVKEKRINFNRTGRKLIFWQSKIDKTYKKPNHK